VTLLAFAAEHGPAVCRDAAAPGGRPGQSVSPARRAHSSKPATCCCSGRQIGQTDGHRMVIQLCSAHCYIEKQMILLLAVPLQNDIIAIIYSVYVLPLLLLLLLLLPFYGHYFRQPVFSTGVVL